ncbi:hypothetical protein [Paraburkholderia sp. BL10I2N1]|uniref:hypothetical protein n=1 Tax=Paraburkholderia sp. BL10I2N1 TaxID=1938796 RepID=UPI00105FC355|nr:hypothetical protein [Paraburkholderia sp. BL10I2N1]TDN62725.1 hypothetical protein B0G77_6312 [Paraburkholderia sp. BL10I2N1]
MQYTVIGLFDTYALAEGARDTLVQTGFPRAAIELQANPEPPPAAGVNPDTNPEAGSHGFMINIERFFANLFASGPRPEDGVRYTEAVRRGAVLVRVSVASEAHAELARHTLANLGATDICERPPSWDSPIGYPDDGRERSMLDELGIGATASVPPTVRRSYESVSAVSRPIHDPLSSVPPVPPATTRQPLDLLDPDDRRNAVEPVRVEPRELPPVRPATQMDQPAARAVATAAAPGSGAYMAPPAPPAGSGGIGAPIPDEFLEYEEDFRGHYDEQYAKEGARYEDYSGAYLYGAKMGQDARYRDRPWDDVEPEARRDWEAMPQGDTWERFKAAIRHGWDRVTGHHHV